MSQFRNALKQHFVENGINIAQLSQQCGVNRTTIQHMIGNSTKYKLPGNETLRKVLKCLPLTPGERNSIEELFAIEKQGVHNYMSRKYVKRIIEQVASDPGTQIDSANQHVVNMKGVLETGSNLFMGVNAVNSVVYSVCAEAAGEDNPHLRLTVPFSYTYLKQILLQLYWESGGDFAIDHLIIFAKSPQTNADPNINLKTLEEISPFTLGAGQKYNANYYYSSLDTGNELLLAMPYYLVTNRRLLLLSSDFMSAMLINDQQIIDRHKLVFDEKFGLASVLLQYYDTPLKVLSAYSKNLNPDNRSFVIEAQPCLLIHITEEMFHRRAHRTFMDMEATLTALMNYIAIVNKLKGATYFPREGLESFVASGRLEILPEAYMEVFSIRERIELLESFTNNKTVGHKTQMVVSSKLPISARVNIGLYENSVLRLYSTGHDTFHSCSIEERSIIESFTDFFESLPDSDMVYSEEETMSVIRYYIDKLKSELGD